MLTAAYPEHALWWRPLERSGNPFPLAGPFSIGDTCLAVGGFDRGPSFAMFANLYIREIHLFGAVMLTVAGSVPKLDLLSGSSQ